MTAETRIKPHAKGGSHPDQTPGRDQHSDATDGDHLAAVQTEPETSNEEYGGRKGPNPTRYGDWEKNGRCIDF